VVDLNDYFTQDELSEFVGGYVSEGYFTDDHGLKILPIAKSTEILLLNETAWQPFALATGATYDDLATIEGLTAVAQQYYEWTDSLTPEPNDGQAFFGRDSMANYLLVCAMQKGVELFSVESGSLELHFYHDTVRDLWDNYYVPYIKGYFAAQERYRSADVKLGIIAAYVGSSSSATYFPEEVVLSDNECIPIEMTVLPSPQFEGGIPCAVQQGAGMVVVKSTEERVQASVQFLKWFTQTDNNAAFSAQSGYLPVNREANSLEKLLSHMEDATIATGKVLLTAMDTVSDNRLYTPKAFENGATAREILETCMSDRAAEDRAVVVQRLAEGQTLEQAVEDFVSDAYFEAWYNATKAELEALEN
jgi:multiple sugar transport system substrate-binding protein